MTPWVSRAWCIPGCGTDWCYCKNIIWRLQAPRAEATCRLHARPNTIRRGFPRKSRWWASHTGSGSPVPNVHFVRHIHWWLRGIWMTGTYFQLREYAGRFCVGNSVASKSPRARYRLAAPQRCLAIQKDPSPIHDAPPLGSRAGVLPNDTTWSFLPLALKECTHSLLKALTSRDAAIPQHLAEIRPSRPNPPTEYFPHRMAVPTWGKSVLMPQRVKWNFGCRNTGLIYPIKKQLFGYDTQKNIFKKDLELTSTNLYSMLYSQIFCVRIMWPVTRLPRTAGPNFDKIYNNLKQTFDPNWTIFPGIREVASCWKSGNNLEVYFTRNDSCHGMVWCIEALRLLALLRTVHSSGASLPMQSFLGDLI